jgi:hypothetical protein
LSCALEGPGGIGRGEGERAGRRVLAEEQRLRAFEDLDLLHVEQALIQHAALAVIDAVDIDRDRLLDPDAGEVGADPAQTEIGAAAGAAARDHELRRRDRDLLDRADIAIGELLRPDGGDGDGDVLHRLGALAGGDDQLFQAHRLGGLTCRRLRRGGARRAENQQGRSGPAGRQSHPSRHPVVTAAHFAPSPKSRRTAQGPSIV